MSLSKAAREEDETWEMTLPFDKYTTPQRAAFNFVDINIIIKAIMAQSHR